MTADNLFARYKNQNPNQDQKDETQKNEAYDGFTQEELCLSLIHIFYRNFWSNIK